MSKWKEFLDLGWEVIVCIILLPVAFSLFVLAVVLRVSQ